MRRIAVCFFLIVSFAAASETFDFHEKRYIYAIDKSMEREGSITFDAQYVTIKYDKPEMSIITLFEDTITVQNGEELKIIKESDSPVIYYMFVMLRAIFADDLQAIKKYFDINTEVGTTRLIPRDMAKKYIAGISFQKETRLKHLQINLKNGDTLTIEPIN